jgi:hypothetical protein
VRCFDMELESRETLLERVIQHVLNHAPADCKFATLFTKDNKKRRKILCGIIDTSVELAELLSDGDDLVAYVLEDVLLRYNELKAVFVRKQDKNASYYQAHKVSLAKGARDRRASQASVKRFPVDPSLPSSAPPPPSAPGERDF